MTTNFHYIRRLEEYQEALLALADSSELAVDTETYALPEWKSKGSALDPHTGRISLLIAKGRETEPYVFDILWLQEEGADFKQLMSLLTSREYLLLHNARFDLKFMLSTFGVMPENVRDTLILSKLLGNATGSKAARIFGHGYADLCRDYLNVHISGKKTERESTWYCGLASRNLENDWWAKKVTYAANDVVYLFELHDILYKALTDPLPRGALNLDGTTEDWGLNMKEVVEREFAYIPLIAEREYRGFNVSKTALKELARAVDDRLREVGVRLSIAFELDTPVRNWNRQLEPTKKAMETLRFSKTLLDCIKKLTKLNKLDNVQGNVLSRLVEILDKLASLEKLKESDEESSSEIFVDEEEELLYSELTEIEESAILKLCPIMQDVLEFKRLSKQSGMKLEKFINPKTGRIHSSFDQLGTATGRIASQRPNLQQVSNRIKVEVDVELEKLFELEEPL